MSHAARAAVLVTAALAGVLAVAPAPALAALNAQAVSATQTLSSGTWVLEPSTTTSPPSSPGGLSLNVSLLAPSWFYAVNAGTEPLAAGSYTTSAPGLGTVTLSACVGGTWNEAADTCSGTITTIGSSSGTPASSSVVPSAAGSSLLIRATASLLATVTVSTAVSSSQLAGIGVTDS